MMNADTGKIIGQATPIGDRVDTTIFDPETGMIASATREGTIHIFHEDTPDTYSVVETVKTEFGAKTLAHDPKTHNSIRTLRILVRLQLLLRNRPIRSQSPSRERFVC